MNNNLTIINQSIKLVLNRTKNLFKITNNLLSKKENWQLISNFKYKPFIKENEHTGSVNSVTISPNGKIAVSGSEDSSIKIWDIQSGECLNTLKGHLNKVNSVGISHDGKTLVSGSNDESIKVWDIQSGKCLNTVVS